MIMNPVNTKVRNYSSNAVEFFNPDGLVFCRPRGLSCDSPVGSCPTLPTASFSMMDLPHHVSQEAGPLVLQPGPAVELGSCSRNHSESATFHVLDKWIRTVRQNVIFFLQNPNKNRGTKTGGKQKANSKIIELNQPSIICAIRCKCTKIPGKEQFLK